MQNQSTNNNSSHEPSVNESPGGTEIQLRQFSVSAAGRPLLQNCSATIPAGKVTLILGCSGVGKSVLLKILAGLIDHQHPAIRFSGDIDFRQSGKEVSHEHSGSPVAVVFQNYALFDELSPGENVEIALDHVPGDQTKQTSKERALELLNELGVPSDRPTSVLSGGQQQRLAIARAIALNTDIVLYDEPTSGLDANTASQVADLIRETQTRFQRTTVVVTHDYQALQRIADRVLVLNHHTLQLQEVSPEEWDNVPQIIGTPPSVEESALPVSDNWYQSIASGFLRMMSATGQTVEELVKLPVALLPWWKSFRWGFRRTWYYLKLVSGWSACIYIAIAGMIIGFVAQDFIFRYLPFRQYSEPLLIENLLHATGFSLYRFLVPILCTILISARSGAAVSADVGSKVYGNQIDAMKTIGMEPQASLRTPILYAFLVGTPLLTFLCYAVASFTSCVAFLSTHASYGVAFWDAHFHKELHQPISIFYKGTGWLLAKLLCCAVGIAMISWRCGSSPKQSSAAISRGITQTILWSTLLTLMVHFVFSLLEFKATK